MPKRISLLLTLLLCLGCCVFSISLAHLLVEPAARAWFSPAFLAEWFRVGEAMRLTATHYVEPQSVSFDKLGSRALTGLVDKLDQYSEYLPPAAFDNFQQQTEQTFVGIGVSLEYLDGYPTIIRVFPGSGAVGAGASPGDQIIAAAGQSAAGESVETIVQRLRGAAGTAVELQLRAHGTTTLRTVAVERRKISTATAFSRGLLGNGTACIRVTQFESKTAAELGSLLDQLAAQGMTRLVLDLRNNPGGLVSAAVDTVGLFCPEGTVVTASRGRIRAENYEYKTRQPGRFPTLPVAILVNRESASAAEIVSGALQDLRRAVIIGDRTFGKGVVQSVFTLDDSHGLKITTARYVLPSGRSIQDSGVQPDIYQPMDRRSRVLISIADTWREIGLEDEFVRRFSTPPEDVQLNAALDFLDALKLANATAARP